MPPASGRGVEGWHALVILLESAAIPFLCVSMDHGEPGDHIGRTFPAKGILLSTDMPLMLFCTVCAEDRVTWIAQDAVHRALHQLWETTATAWLVGEYVLMPDHAHFMCCPRAIREGTSVERWTSFWKDRLSRHLLRPDWKWQWGIFHTRMRSDAHIQEKLDYMRNNPVAQGLVSRAEDWPWRGVVHDLHRHIQSFGEPRDG